MAQVKKKKLEISARIWWKFMNLGKTLVDLRKRLADLEPKPGETQSEWKSSQGSTDKHGLYNQKCLIPACC